MTEPMTREEGAQYLTEFAASLRRTPPAHVDEVAPPSDRERLNAMIDRIYEGYAEDLKRVEGEPEALESRT